MYLMHVSRLIPVILGLVLQICCVGDVFGADANSGVTAQRTNTPQTLSHQYPNDAGIGADPAIVWYEEFDEASIPEVVARYEVHRNDSAMSFVVRRDATGTSRRALTLVAGGGTDATDLYKSLPHGYEELFVRYYIRYEGAGPWHHSGVWIGGSNPSLPYPYPHAGERPSGDDRFIVALEPMDSVVNPRMDFYAYWLGMHSWKDAPTGVKGDFWGNTLIHDSGFRATSGAWECLEVHLKLNPDPSNDSGAILEVWHNDVPVIRFDDHGPGGSWVKDKFCPVDATSADCTDYKWKAGPPTRLNQQWRSSDKLEIDYLWIQNYNTKSDRSSLSLAQVVAATRRIGCMVVQMGK